MKKYLLIVLFLLNGYGYAFTQATCPPGINENFDGLSNSYVSTGTPGWTIDSNFFTSSPK